MLTGDDAGLPARDKGPVRRFMRDHIDARRNLAEFMLPVMLIVLALSFMRTSQRSCSSSTILIYAAAARRGARHVPHVARPEEEAGRQVR